MRTFATTSESTAPARGHWQDEQVPSSRPAFSPVSEALLQRKPHCACGGGCPRCRQGNLIQHKLAISTPGDQYEQEADHVAGQVLQMKEAPCACGGGCARCVEKKNPLVQRKVNESVGQLEQSVPDSLVSGLGTGQPLDPASRRFFEPRFGQDFGDVRVHTGEASDAAASSVGARAFTLGHNLVFAAGEFAPHTDEGRRLIAHELVHWVQQGGRANQVQRLLKVDAPASDDPKTAIPQMRPLIQKLCPHVEVSPTSGDVTGSSGSSCQKLDWGALAAATTNKLGCCCLCTLAVSPGTKWRIIVTITEAPTTDRSARVVRMIPTTGAGAPDLRSWTSSPTEKIVSMPPEEALGHELCGHAVLMQINAHPPEESADTIRTFSDIHDPTVKIQNALASEMHPGATPRGLAAGGTHRGESLRVFQVSFGKDSDTITTKAQRDIIDGAAAFAKGNEGQLIDVVGFRDTLDTVTAISKTRADAVRADLDTKMKSLKTKSDADFHLSKGAPATSITRLQPATDGGIGSSAVVEIRFAREPAGLLSLPSKVTLPATPEHVGPLTPGVVDPVIKGKGSTKNACYDELIKTAWKP